MQSDPNEQNASPSCLLCSDIAFPMVARPDPEKEFRPGGSPGFMTARQRIDPQQEVNNGGTRAGQPQSKRPGPTSTRDRALWPGQLARQSDRFGRGPYSAGNRFTSTGWANGANGRSPFIPSMLPTPYNGRVGTCLTTGRFELQCPRSQVWPPSCECSPPCVISLRLTDTPAICSARAMAALARPEPCTISKR